MFDNQKVSRYILYLWFYHLKAFAVLCLELSFLSVKCYVFHVQINIIFVFCAKTLIAFESGLSIYLFAFFHAL